MKEIKISIIIPIYNAASFLECCIGNILTQPFSNYEVILIDDGSTDASGLLCDKYANKYDNVKTFHQQNSGPSVARNLGISVSRGEWITFVDSDDCVTSDYLQVIYDKGLKADITFFSNNICYEDDVVEKRKLPESLSISKQEIESEICHLKQNDENYEYFGYTWNKVFRASIIKQNDIRFVDGLIIREDELFTASFIQHANTLATIPDIIYNYRYSMQGLTGKKKSAWQWRTFSEGLLKYMSNWENLDLIRIDVNRFLDHMFRGIDVERNVIDFLRDCVLCKKVVCNYGQYVDYSHYTAKQSHFLVGNPLPFIIRKIVKRIFIK